MGHREAQSFAVAVPLLDASRGVHQELGLVLSEVLIAQGCIYVVAVRAPAQDSGFATADEHLSGAYLYHRAAELRRYFLARALEVVPARGRQRIAILQPRVGLVSQTENKRVFAASVGLRIVFYRCVNLIFLFCLSILKFLDKSFCSSANAVNPTRG